jgi:hypothetical protein
MLFAMRRDSLSKNGVHFLGFTEVLAKPWKSSKSTGLSAGHMTP